MSKVPEYTKRAISKYNKENTKSIAIRLNRKTDADVIEFLEGCDNVAGLLKKLVREEMKKG